MELSIMQFKYGATPDSVLKFFNESGQKLFFDIELFNATLTIEAPDEDTADKIRMTVSDITMWKKL
jgi:hypothetical protein